MDALRAWLQAKRTSTSYRNMDTSKKTRRTTSGASSRTRSIAFVGLSIALIAVSAWVTIPIGPVPFTLQMLSISFLICALKPTQAIAAVYGYVVLGAIGVPVFSGMRGGIGVILGPTGGFIDGYLIGVPMAVGLLYLVDRIRMKRASCEEVACDKVAMATDNVAFSVGAETPTGTSVSPDIVGLNIQKSGFLTMLRRYGWSILACLVFVVVSYAIGTLQYTFVAHVGVEAALIACVLPFIVPDIVKVVLGAACAQAVNAALGLRSRS